MLKLFHSGSVQVSDRGARRSSRHLGAVLRADGLAAGVHRQPACVPDQSAEKAGQGAQANTEVSHHLEAYP